MTSLTIRDSDLRELATLCGLDHRPSHSPGDATILVTLGPEQTPSRIAIRRSAWPSLTTLNYSEGREFHVRLRQHTGTGVYLVYGSVTRPDRSIIQRGHLCRTLGDVERVIPLLRKELGLPDKPGQLPP
jgi:hypothetical protein